MKVFSISFLISAVKLAILLHSTWTDAFFLPSPFDVLGLSRPSFRTQYRTLRHHQQRQKRQPIRPSHGRGPPPLVPPPRYTSFLKKFNGAEQFKRSPQSIKQTHHQGNLIYRDMLKPSLVVMNKQPYIPSRIPSATYTTKPYRTQSRPLAVHKTKPVFLPPSKTHGLRVVSNNRAHQPTLTQPAAPHSMNTIHHGSISADTKFKASIQSKPVNEVKIDYSGWKPVYDANEEETSGSGEKQHASMKTKEMMKVVSDAQNYKDVESKVVESVTNLPREAKQASPSNDLGEFSNGKIMKTESQMEAFMTGDGDVNKEADDDDKDEIKALGSKISAILRELSDDSTLDRNTRNKKSVSEIILSSHNKVKQQVGNSVEKEDEQNDRDESFVVLYQRPDDEKVMVLFDEDNVMNQEDTSTPREVQLTDTTHHHENEKEILEATNHVESEKMEVMDMGESETSTKQTESKLETVSEMMESSTLHDKQTSTRSDDFFEHDEHDAMETRDETTVEKEKKIRTKFHPTGNGKFVKVKFLKPTNGPSSDLLGSFHHKPVNSEHEVSSAFENHVSVRKPVGHHHQRVNAAATAAAPHIRKLRRRFPLQNTHGFRYLDHPTSSQQAFSQEQRRRRAQQIIRYRRRLQQQQHQRRLDEEQRRLEEEHRRLEEHEVERESDSIESSQQQTDQRSTNPFHQEITRELPPRNVFKRENIAVSDTTANDVSPQSVNNNAIYDESQLFNKGHITTHQNSQSSSLADDFGLPAKTSSATFQILIDGKQHGFSHRYTR